MKALPFAFAAALVAVAVPTQAQTVEHRTVCALPEFRTGHRYHLANAPGARLRRKPEQNVKDRRIVQFFQGSRRL